MIYGFTWSLNKNEDALRHALDMLAQTSGPWIAAFQETPNHAALLTELARRGLADTCLAPGGRAALAIVYSGLTQTASFLRDEDDEYLAARFRAPTSSLDFICVCVHAKSKVDLASDASVGGARALLRHDISRIWDGGRLVLLGDFNSAPTDPEMVDWYCFYGLAPASERPKPQGPFSSQTTSPFRPLSLSNRGAP
jgi:hypothetical protein